MTKAGMLYVLSFAAHGALALGVASIRARRVQEDVSVSIIETKKAEKPREAAPPPPDPPEEKKEAPKTKAAKAPEPKAAPEPSPASNDAPASAAPDFGLSLGGETRGGGLAVRSGSAPTAVPAQPDERVVKKVLAAPSDACDEPAKKPKVITIARPAYSAEAREAGIKGKVRVEVTVDASGKVQSARVIAGLGYGLDEAALAAAKAATFEPGTKCGKPVVATFTIGMSFAG